MGYHVHVHYLVPAGGLDPETGALAAVASEISRARLGPAGGLPSKVPRRPLRRRSGPLRPGPAGHLEQDMGGALQVSRGRTHRPEIPGPLRRPRRPSRTRRLVALNEGQVTFRYTPRTKPWTTMTLDVMSFMQRFLQHVLPKGFQKIRYTGFLHPNARTTFTALQEQLAAEAADERLPEALAATFGLDIGNSASDDAPPDEPPRCCPHCGGPLAFVGRFPRTPHRRGPP